MLNVNRINQNTEFSAKTPDVNTEYSALKMSQTNEGSGDMGFLYPLFVRELLPSQRVALNQEITLQFNPFVTNLYHELYGEILNYFVPMRLLWDGWENFITGGITGADSSTPPTIGYVRGKNYKGTIHDYLGMPIDLNKASSGNHKPTALYHRAYNQVLNDHIRVPDLQPTPYNLDDIEIKRGNWEWDYFTRSRIYQQRGVLPTVPVNDALEALNHEIEMGYFDANDNWFGVKTPTYQVTGITSPTTPEYVKMETANSKLKGANVPEGSISFTMNGRPGSKREFGSNLYILPHKLEKLGMDLNSFVTAMAIMRYQTHNARVEPRYIDQLNMRFGIYPQDSRLQRAEYLGSKYFNIQTQTIAQTSPGGTGQTKQGNLTGQASGVGRGLGVTYEAQEHGILMSLVIIRPKTVYDGGMNRMYLRKSRFDFATPELANIPDQPVLQGEIRWTGDPTQDNKTFGYQGIYEPYRTMQNIVCGDLRPSIGGNLRSYTLARYWAPDSPPKLNKNFIECKPDKKRILQYTNRATFIYFMRTEMKTSLPLPVQSDPGNMRLM